MQHHSDVAAVLRHTHASRASHKRISRCNITVMLQLEHLLIILHLLILCRGVLVPLVCCCRVVVALLLSRFLTALPRQLGSTQIATTSEMWVSSKVIVSLQVHKNRFRCTLASLSINTLQVRDIAHDFHFQRLITAKTLSCIARSEHSRMGDSSSARQRALSSIFIVVESLFHIICCRECSLSKSQTYFLFRRFPFLELAL